MAASVVPAARLRVNLADVEAVLPLKSWWAIILVLPLVRRLTLLTVNHTSLTPNAITSVSILLRLLAAGFFLMADQPCLVAGAVAFYLAYLLDCMDGAVARLKRMSSEFGRYLDHLGDLVGGLVTVAALAAGQGMLLEPLVAGLLFVHVAEYYISYLTSTVIKLRATLPAGTPEPNSGPLGWLLTWRGFFHERNVKSFFSFPDYEAAIFCLFPLLGKPVLGLQVGFAFAVAVTLYTVLSSFVAILSGGTKFP